MPELNGQIENFVRAAYGVLLFGTLALVLPHGRRFFVSERWGGYAQSARDVDWLQNPRVYPLLMFVWLGAAVLIALGWWSVWAALLNLLLCRYFFIRMRWRGVLRGMGAPGFMTYWLALAVFLLEYTRHYAPDLFSLALLALQVDFGLIFISAGLYKLSAGYARNHGMELGLANPAWGYWWRFYSQLPPGHWLFKCLDQLGWSTELLAGVLMLLPPTRFIGGLIVIVSFVFVAAQIRLALLTELVMLCGVLYFEPGSLGAAWIDHLTVPDAINPDLSIPAIINIALSIALWAYLVLLPFAHLGLFYNFYARRSFPRTVQRLLEIYTNWFGIIIWRVFSVDHLNFFIRIHAHDPHTNQRTLISRYGFGGSRRYNQVAESITVTTLFTTLKYHASNSALFQERLLRYARTVPHPRGTVLVFEYISVDKRPTHFAFVPLAEYTVDITAGTVASTILNESISVHAAHASSPVHEGVRPGSYAPLTG